MGLVGRAVAKVREINRRYSRPRIPLSRGTKVILMVLRVYLLTLVGLLAYALVTTNR